MGGHSIGELGDNADAEIRKIARSFKEDRRAWFLERLRELNGQGFAPEGFDLERCVEVKVEKKPFALFAFSASSYQGGARSALHPPKSFALSVEDSDVSPGYGELAPARVVAVRLSGEIPVRLWTAVLVLGGGGVPTLGAPATGEGVQEGRE